MGGMVRGPRAVLVCPLRSNFLGPRVGVIWAGFALMSSQQSLARNAIAEPLRMSYLPPLQFSWQIILSLPHSLRQLLPRTCVFRDKRTKRRQVHLRKNQNHDHITQYHTTRIVCARAHTRAQGHAHTTTYGADRRTTLLRSPGEEKVHAKAGRLSEMMEDGSAMDEQRRAVAEQRYNQHATSSTLKPSQRICVLMSWEHPRMVAKRQAESCGRGLQQTCSV